MAVPTRMDDPGRQRWLGTALLAGVVYGAVGIVFGELAGAAGSSPMGTFWRLGAWVVSAVVFAAHIAHEHFRLHRTTRQTAWHTAVAVASGGFALAAAASVHELWTASAYRPRMLIALVAWPLLTAVPAFVVALAVAAGLRMTRPRA